MRWSYQAAVRQARHRRRSIRLKGYDYSQPGAYFVTLCTKDFECLFGVDMDGAMRSNPAGEMVWRWWNRLAERFPGIDTDAAVVMHNHFHGVIVIVGQPRGGAPTSGRPDGSHPDIGQPRVVAPTLGDVAGWFKSMTTNESIRGVKRSGWSAFPGSLWQHNAYEHIIRDVASLDRIRAYIAANPARWDHDRENPDRTAGGMP